MKNKYLCIIIGVLVVINVLSFFIGDGFLGCETERINCNEKLTMETYKFNECLGVLENVSVEYNKILDRCLNLNDEIKTELDSCNDLLLNCTSLLEKY